MPEISEEEVAGLLDTIRGSTPDSNLRKGVEAIIKADAKKTKEKIDTEKKLLDKIKAAAEKLKNEKKKEESSDNTEGESHRHSEKDKDGKFKKKETDTPKEDEDEAEGKIKELTEQMEKMTKEIDALKKRKNYRTKPPKADVVDEVDDFIKQNITKDFEVLI